MQHVSVSQTILQYVSFFFTDIQIATCSKILIVIGYKLKGAVCGEFIWFHHAAGHVYFALLPVQKILLLSLFKSLTVITSLTKQLLQSTLQTSFGVRWRLMAL